tara:strand:- start:329 stop:550 length:222 start_codon:yes stop_codon:yes gene_type:complete
MKARLLEKEDLLKMIEPHRLNEFKKWKVKDLREHFGITHRINNENRNMKGHCFKCLKPLRPDYTVFENYCLDC